MDLKYTITKSSKRRKLIISVERDRSVIVRAPEGMSDTDIEKIVTSKRQWIYEKIGHPQKYHLPHAPGKEIVSGESALYLGRQYRIEIVKTRASEIHFTQHFLVPEINIKKRKEIFCKWYIGQAIKEIIPRVKYHARKLGVRYVEAKIIDNRYRWGSCTLKNNVNFNWRLIKAPMFAIDYVIVHELTHLIEGNHTPRFWNIIRSQLAHVEKAKQWLKEHGQLLEQAV